MKTQSTGGHLEMWVCCEKFWELHHISWVVSCCISCVDSVELRELYELLFAIQSDCCDTVKKAGCEVAVLCTFLVEQHNVKSSSCSSLFAILGQSLFVWEQLWIFLVETCKLQLVTNCGLTLNLYKRWSDHWSSPLGKLMGTSQLVISHLPSLPPTTPQMLKVLKDADIRGFCCWRQGSVSGNFSGVSWAG